MVHDPCEKYVESPQILRSPLEASVLMTVRAQAVPSPHSFTKLVVHLVGS